MVYLSHHKSTDAAVASLLDGCDTASISAQLESTWAASGQSSWAAAGTGAVALLPPACSGLGKAMVLFSARNTLRLNPRVFFAWNEGFASLWYAAAYWHGYGALADQTALRNMQQHMAASDMPPALYISPTSTFALDCLLNMYYMCTYYIYLHYMYMRYMYL